MQFHLGWVPKNCITKLSPSFEVILAEEFIRFCESWGGAPQVMNKHSRDESNNSYGCCGCHCHDGCFWN